MNKAIEEIKDPIIVEEREGSYKVIDGYHRYQVVLEKNKILTPVIVCRKRENSG